MKTYFISGIAADHRLFRRIVLPTGYEAVYLDWIKPGKKELLKDYAFRLAEKINTQEPFILIGTSLGGIMAVEIALRHPPLIVVIIGSISLASQLPGYYRLLGKLHIHRILPVSFYKITAKLKHRFTKENAEDKTIIIQMIADTNPAFISWGIDAVLGWKNEQVPLHLFHIHGTRDELFPYRRSSPTHTIVNGDHVIVITKANEVNAILQEILPAV